MACTNVNAVPPVGCPTLITKAVSVVLILVWRLRTLVASGKVTPTNVSGPQALSTWHLILMTTCASVVALPVSVVLASFSLLTAKDVINVLTLVLAATHVQLLKIPLTVVSLTISASLPPNRQASTPSMDFNRIGLQAVV